MDATRVGNVSKQGKKKQVFEYKIKKTVFLILKLLSQKKISIVWESDRCDRGVSRLPLLSRINLYKAAHRIILNVFFRKKEEMIISLIFFLPHIFKIISVRAES